MVDGAEHESSAAPTQIELWNLVLMNLASRRALVTVLLIVGVVAAPFLWGLMVWDDYPTTQTATRTFELPEGFTTVRKILVRKDGAKQIITMGGDSEFVEQSWKNLDAATGKQDIGQAVLDLVASSDPTWRLQLEGTLKVRTLDDYIGRHVVTLRQDVVIEPDSLDSTTTLVQGTDRLIGYDMQTRFSRDQASAALPKSTGPLGTLLAASQDEGTTVVELSLTQKIITQAPWFAHRVADRRVRESVEQTLANQEQAIRQFIEENKGDVPVFPLR